MEQSYVSFPNSVSATPRLRAWGRYNTYDGALYLSTSHSRSALFSQRLASALSSNKSVHNHSESLEASKVSYSDHRAWYDQVWKKHP